MPTSGTALAMNSYFAGYGISALLHVSLLSAMIWWYTPQWQASINSPGGIETAVGPLSAERPDDAVLPDASQPDDEHSDERVAVESAPSAASPGLGAFARQRLESARKSVESKSLDENLKELESLGNQLNGLATEESVRDVADTLSNWLGAKPRAGAPSPTEQQDAAAFDSSTAQISDVNRVETETGTTYIATLVDANGGRKDVELSETDGPELYRVFQLMKRFPLLDSVYRNTVMGLLDKLAESPAMSDVPQPLAAPQTSAPRP